MLVCCVSGCENKGQPCSKIRLYKIPAGKRSFQAKRRRLWLQAIKKVNGSAEGLGESARVCGAHFISGQASMEIDNPDFVPSVFTNTQQTPGYKKKAKWFFTGKRRKRQGLKTNAEAKETTTPPKGFPPVEFKTPPSLSFPKEEETNTKEDESKDKTTESGTTSSSNKTSPSLGLPAGTSELDKMPVCCVIGCGNRQQPSSKLRFFKIPVGSRKFQANQRRLWLQVIRKANGTIKGLGNSAHVCGVHFVSGQASMKINDPDFVPSVFICTKRKRKWVFSGRSRKRRRCKANAEAKGTTTPPMTPPRGYPPVEFDMSSPSLSPSSPSFSEVEGTPTKEDVTENKAITSQTTSSPNKVSLSLKLPAGLPELDKMMPSVLLKPVYKPASGFQCEHCNQNTTTATQLVKHQRLHEEQRSYICELCGDICTNQKEFSDHQRVHQLSFPCNICDRSFATVQNLKRHKLLHVRDGRKCQKCGVLFCRQHNHILFVPQPESEQESSDGEPEDSDSDLSSEDDEVKEAEPNESDCDVQSTVTITHEHTTTAQCPSPVPQTPEPLFKFHHGLPPASHTQVLTEIPVPEFINPSLEPYPALFVPKFRKTDYPARFVQPHLPHYPELTSSQKIFSPQFLTSTFLKVERNYEYILNKPKVVKIERVQSLVKEEPVELPLALPSEQRVVEEVKKERTAYDLEFIL